MDFGMVELLTQPYPAAAHSGCDLKARVRLESKRPRRRLPPGIRVAVSSESFR